MKATHLRKSKELKKIHQSVSYTYFSNAKKIGQLELHQENIPERKIKHFLNHTGSTNVRIKKKLLSLEIFLAQKIHFFQKLKQLYSIPRYLDFPQTLSSWIVTFFSGSINLSWHQYFTDNLVWVQNRRM